MRDFNVGRLSPKQGWELLCCEEEACLIDVRTPEEWDFVGVPSLGELNRRIFFISWCCLPGMQYDGLFIQTVAEALPDISTPTLLLCRSGTRSYEAALALAEHGYQACYNIEHGFEGDADENDERGKINGWKAANLPWRLR